MKKKKKKTGVAKQDEHGGGFSTHDPSHLNTEEHELGDEGGMFEQRQNFNEVPRQQFDYQNMIDQNSSFVNEEHGLRGASSEAFHL